MQLSITLMAVSLCIFYSQYYFVGYFLDDAVYTLGAKALLHGHYVDLAHPLSLPITTFLPGYPLFLAPFVALVDPHWSFLKIVSILLTLASGGILFELSNPSLKPMERLVLFGAYLFNSRVNYASSWIMTEGFYTFLTLLSFLMLRKTIEAKEDRNSVWLGLIMGWIMIIRPIGLILALSLAAILLISKRRQEALRSLGIGFVILGMVVLRNFSVSHQATGYLPLWRQSIEFLSTNLWVFLDNGIRITNLFFVYAPWSLRLPYSALGICGTLLIACFVFFLMWQGYRLFIERQPSRIGVFKAMVLYLMGYYFIHAFWAAIDLRYALPVLPFVLMLTIGGFLNMTAGLRKPWMNILGVGFLFIATVFGHYRLHITLSENAHEPAHRFPSQTIAWIKDHIASDALLLSPRASLLSLYTNRHAVTTTAGDLPNDREEFRYQLLTQGVTHLLSEPLNPLLRPRLEEQPIDRIRQIDRWIQSWPDAFRTVYNNPLESETIVEVLPSSKFIKAFDLYRGARHDLDESHFKEALKKLNSALAYEPHFVKALNASGMALLLKGNQLDRAEARFKEALRYDPDYALALLNLAHVYRLKGEREKAHDLINRLSRLIQETGLFHNLQPAIASEKQWL